MRITQAQKIGHKKPRNHSPRYWENRIKKLLIDVVLAQEGRKDRRKVAEDIVRFFEDAMPKICEALRRNGAVCFPELVEEFGNIPDAFCFP